MALFLLLFSLVIYFIPTMLALDRRHHNANSIIVVNIFLGWTIIGWIVALAWAVSNSPVRAQPAAH